MGRKESSRFRKTIHQQAYEKLSAMQAFGDSRSDDKADGTAIHKIYSYETYRTYWRHIRYYLRWLQKTHPECTTLKKSRRYVNEWLEYRTDQGLSAWTIQTECAALCKLYGIRADDPDRFRPPRRRRADIKRSRMAVARDRHFSTTNNYELIEFVRATGTRRNVIQRLRGDDYWTRTRMEQKVAQLQAMEVRHPADQTMLENLQEALTLFPDYGHFLHHRRDKGGKSRFAPIIGPNRDMVIRRMRETPPQDRVWEHVHSAADIHAYRSDYATRLYKAHARRIQDIPYDRLNQGSGQFYQSQVYVCRGDERGKKYDKQAMYLASKSLGHNRLSIIADHYLRGI